ncbi:Uncharacterized protein TCM_010399 [Theobroma cacao]|uniref:Uncharacterized protein n=1 Tax=Theobroma cacao TaxID=3641 RepID=A0A061E670_THECC|nr:Uncharacterized protein TCM_010399 [Theobroma cacao]
MDGEEGMTELRTQVLRMEGFFTGEKDRGRPRKKPEREKEGNDAGSSPRSIGLGCCCTLNLLELSV